MIIDKRKVYNELESFLMNGTFPKELFILSGVYGVGKTTLLTVLGDKLNTSLHIHINFNKSEVDGLVSLKNAICDFIRLNKIQKKKKKFKMSGFLTTLINSLEFKASASIGLETAAGVNLELDILEAIKTTIENRYEHYLDTIDKAKSREFPQTLARIVQEITSLIGERLYITLDEIEKMDSNSAVFIYELLKNDCVLSMVCSTESKNTEISNYHFLETINNYFTRNIETTKCNSSKLSEFSLLETSEYINMRYNSKFNEIDPLILKIHEKTAGLPLLLSVVCANNSLTEIKDLTLKAETEEWLGRIYNETINSLDEAVRKTLFIVSIAGGNIYDSVLENVLQIPSQERYSILEILQRKELLYYEEESGEFHIKYKILSEYINKSNHISLYEEKQQRQLIINAYENCPIESISKARALSFLYLKSKHHKKAFEWSKTYGNLSLRKCMQDRYIEDANKIAQNIILEPQDIAQLHSLLIRAYYSAGDINSCIELFNNLKQEEINSLNESEDYSILCVIVAQAYYYQNDYHNTIIHCKRALNNCKGNYHIFLESFLKLISTYDLNGEYDSALINYNKGIKLANDKEDLLAKGSYLMVTQMIHNNYHVCCTNLIEAIDIFKNTPHVRNLACVHNNLGIEYLMKGNQSGALEHLKESEKILNSQLSLELHFVQNNLGLYYLLNNQHIDAKSYLMEALKGAISPLQYAYIYNNLAILDIVAYEKKSADKFFEKAMYHLIHCPDPIVYCNVKYNYSKYLYLIDDLPKAIQLFPKDKLGAINVNQYYPLIKKITNLGRELGLNLNNLTQPQQLITDRRSFFIENDWQPCELMFYN